MHFPKRTGFFILLLQHLIKLMKMGLVTYVCKVQKGNFLQEVPIDRTKRRSHFVGWPRTKLVNFPRTGVCGMKLYYCGLRHLVLQTTAMSPIISELTQCGLVQHNASSTLYRRQVHLARQATPNNWNSLIKACAETQVSQDY